MNTVGAHISIAQGYLSAAKTAQSIGANTFQFFTRNPRGGAAKAIDEADIQALDQYMQDNQFGALLAHAPYTLNLASTKEETRTFARDVLEGDLALMHRLPAHLYNIHPGSHTGDGVDIGIERITAAINAVLREDLDCYLLLETMSGKGSEIGKTFEEIRRMIDNIDYKKKIGVCLDTCHIYCAGYDIVENPEGVLEEFDRIIGLKRLMAIHVNDTMNPFSSHKDRHAKLGEGYIGLDAMERFLTQPALKDLPLLLETPCTLEEYAKEIALLRSFS